MEIDLIGPNELTEEERRARFNAAITRGILSKAESQYKTENNPLYVWAAINICASFRAPMPSWVLDYLRDASYNLIRFGRGNIDEYNADRDISNSAPILSKDKRCSETLYQALGFTLNVGDNDSFSRYYKHIRDSMIRKDIAARLADKKIHESKKATIRFVGNKYSVSFESAKKLWYGSKKEGIKSYSELVDELNRTDHRCNYHIF